MSTFSVAFQIFLQGVYSLLWITILIDAGSPSFDLRRFAELPGSQMTLFVALGLIVAYVVGIMMHTGSRSLFRRTKDLWALHVLSSPAVQQRFEELKLDEYLRGIGGPTMREMQEAEGKDRIRAAGAIMHLLDYTVMSRSPEVYQSIQVYRNQYRLARGFVLPSVALGMVLAIWEPITERLVSVQLFLLGILFACFAYLAFKERAYRYEAARLRAFVTLEGERRLAAKG